MAMSEGTKQYQYIITYEQQDALDASAFFTDMNEQGRGVWRAVPTFQATPLFASVTPPILRKLG
jgi:hypothetical protein